ncbi:MAG TPA: lipase family protein [Solirubrobacteraceae bacterium]|nr:lipase family protein [Solirubrobacteraceae bacterium]
MHRMAVARAALALSILAALALAATASAAPVEGPAGSAFYTPPSPTPTGSAGELVWYRPATIDLNVTLPSVKAWTVLYQSTDQHGNPDWVTGTVIVPTAKWSGKGERPLVTYAEGTQGLAHQCAPSIQMAEGTEYDGGAIIESLKRGYAVTVTDYQGYTNGAIPTYTAGKAEGQAVLDVVRAGRQIPGSGIGEKDPVIVWGYSQGGQAAGWAAELQPTYAPDVKMIGLAAGGVPANLQAVREFDNGSVGTAFGLDALIGLDAAYPEEFGLTAQEDEAGLAAGEKLLGECAIQSLAEFRDINIDEYTLGHKTLAQEEAEHPAIERIVSEQELGTKAVPVPVYHYHGLEDEFVPVKQDVELHQKWCALGVKDDFQLYPGDHLLTDPTAIGNVMKWIEERLAGKTAPSTCGDHSASAALPSSARLTPETGDLIIPLPGWELSGKVTEAKSGLSVEVPKGSTLSAEGDVTTGTLSATLSIPPIDQTIDIGLIPVTVKGALTPTGTIHGTVGLTNAGVFSESATGSANELVGSVGVGIFTVPIGCTTVEPIQLPLSISEQVNALVVGGFSFKTTVTVPEFGGCGLFGPVLSATMSGPGNTIEMTAKPPAPIDW